MNLKQEAIETIRFIKENWKDALACLMLFGGLYIWTIILYAIVG